MKALLIIYFAWSGAGHSSITPMPSMAGCKAAAEAIEAKARETFRKGVVSAVCVEDR